MECLRTFLALLLIATTARAGVCRCEGLKSAEAGGGLQVQELNTNKAGCTVAACQASLQTTNTVYYFPAAIFSRNGHQAFKMKASKPTNCAFPCCCPAMHSSLTMNEASGGMVGTISSLIGNCTHVTSAWSIGSGVTVSQTYWSAPGKNPGNGERFGLIYPDDHPFRYKLVNVLQDRCSFTVEAPPPGNGGAIAIGVIVTLVVVAGAIGGFILFRKYRERQLYDEIQ